MTTQAAVVAHGRQVCAIAIALALVISGFWLGMTVHPGWLSRFGSLVIVCGIVFAASDLPRVLDEQIRGRAKVVVALATQRFIQDWETRHGRPLTETERARLFESNAGFERSYTEREAAEPRKRFLLVEATIICIGTILNGFGEWLISTFAIGLCGISHDI